MNDDYSVQPPSSEDVVRNGLVRILDHYDLWNRGAHALEENDLIGSLAKVLRSIRFAKALPKGTTAEQRRMIRDFYHFITTANGYNSRNRKLIMTAVDFEKLSTTWTASRRSDLQSIGDRLAPAFFPQEWTDASNKAKDRYYLNNIQGSDGPMLRGTGRVLLPADEPVTR